MCLGLIGPCSYGLDTDTKGFTVPWASNFEVQIVLEYLKKEKGLPRKVASTLLGFGLFTLILTEIYHCALPNVLFPRKR